jgi:outer membrane protein assembly factor BamB
MLAGCASTEPSGSVPSGGSPTLARTAWPCYGHDPQQTRRTTGIGPELPAKKWLNHDFYGPGPIVLESGMLFAEAFNQKDFDTYYAGLQPQTGKVVWHPSNDDLANAQGTPALLSDGSLVITGTQGNGLSGVRCFVAAMGPDGRTRWRTDFGKTKRALIVKPGDIGEGDPTIGPDGTIYVTAHPGDALYAFSPVDGRVKWSHPVSSIGSEVLVTPKGNVLVSERERGSILAFTPQGKPLWQIDAPRGGGGGAVAPDGTLYYIGDPGLRAVAANGSPRWALTTRVGSSETYDFSSDVALGADGTIYVTDYDWLYAISRVGKVVWRARTGSGGGPVVDGAGVIYIQNGGGWLYAVNRDGSIKWRFKVGEPAAPPVIGGDGTIYCYDGLGESGGMRAIGSGAK